MKHFFLIFLSMFLFGNILNADDQSAKKAKCIIEHYNCVQAVEKGYDLLVRESTLQWVLCNRVGDKEECLDLYKKNLENAKTLRDIYLRGCDNKRDKCLKDAEK